MPEELAGLIPGVGTQRALRGTIQQVQNPDVVLLREVVEGPADQQVDVQLAPQGSELPACTTVQNCLGDTQRAAKSRDEPPDRCHLHLAGRVANQIDITLTDALVDGERSCKPRDSGSLKLDRLEPPFLQEPVEAAANRLAVASDQAEYSPRRGLRDEPVEVRGVLRDEPDPRRVGG